ncbi:MAG: PAS domain-containing protein [candidate division Zixibacteria bacterium]|nr:PAS domain-containing protein [candidate division Zixibacteria bacterium]
MLKRKDLTPEALLTIVDSISDGVFAVDNELKITFLNQSAERITGYTEQEAIGKRCKEIFRSNICDDNCALKETMSTGKPVVNRPVCMTNKSGKNVPISISSALLKDMDGNIIGGVETFRDLDLVDRLRKDFQAKYTMEDMVSRNKAMLEMFEILPAIANSDSAVLIEGETGTGKELVARALHRLSSRNKNDFISINCGALPDNLLESELFGYIAGAFTDAKTDKKGRFALADKGTLFLDEIADISPAMQVKLLRVLQEKTYEPLGATKSERSDARIVAASIKPLDELVDEGEFRPDLYYRINVVKLVIPPLRERNEDIPLLVDHFIGQFNRLRKKDISGLSPPALNLLMNHDFPGNVRELENIIEHAFVLCRGGLIRPEHLPNHIQYSRSTPAIEVSNSMKDMESLFILAALKRNNWSRKETSRELGIHPTTLYRKIKKLGLKAPYSEKQK